MHSPSPEHDPSPGLSEHDPPPNDARGGPRAIVVIAIAAAALILVLLHLTGVVGPGTN